MKKIFILFSFLFVFIFNGNSTHLTGGTLTYRYLGGDSYEINLTLYADPGLCMSPTPVQPGSIVSIEYYNGIGNFLFSATAYKISTTLIPPYQGSCVANDSCYYLKKVIYRDTINLPSIAGGYHLYNETCCRSGTIQNIYNPNTSGPGGGGEGFYARIPERSIYGNNSSPEWKKDPPTFYCINTEVNFNNGAWDTDGDSLVYSFYQPFSDIDYTTPFDLDFISSVPQFSEVAFIPPYHSENVLNLNGTDSLIVDQYGHVHGVPDNLGYFAAGIKCEEFRNGILLSTIYRDLRYLVINCPQMPLADFIPLVDCSGGNVVQFQNIGSGDSYFWDFDTSFVSNDTSNLFSPSYNYSSIQCFDVSLTATNANGCISEETIPVCLGATNASLTMPTSACDSAAVQVTNQSTFPNGTNVTYTWITSQNDTSFINNPTFNFTADSVTVTLIANNSNGCSDTVSQSIVVDLCNGINETSAEDIFDVFPNPNNGTINFQFKTNDIYLIEILNELGQPVSTLTITATSMSVNLTSQPDGMYFLKAYTRNGRILVLKAVKSAKN